VAAEARGDPLQAELQRRGEDPHPRRLTAAEGLERYLHTKYVGQKRFSLEGGESFIASMDEFIQRAGETGVQEIVIGMAHRGRLNVLVNTLGKMPKNLFAEFDHTAPEKPALGRRQVPPGLLERHHDAGRPGPPQPVVQPVAPRDRQSGGRGLGQGPASTAAATPRATRCCRSSSTATPPSPARAW
jgi:hypothetical protein